MKKNLLISSFFILLYSGIMNAQSYKFSMGLRGGFTNGITGKYFIAESKAIEGILTRRYRGYTVTGLYEVQKATKVSSLSWYYGLGAHIASYNSYYYYGYYRYNSYKYKGIVYTGYYGEPVSVLGVDGILGLEYRFNEIPFTVSIDTKPYFDLVGGSDDFFDIALSIRYIIK